MEKKRINKSDEVDEDDEPKIKYRPCKWDAGGFKCFYSQLMMMDNDLRERSSAYIWLWMI